MRTSGSDKAIAHRYAFPTFQVRFSAETYSQHVPSTDNLLGTSANLSMLLFPGDFVDGSQIVLTCSAQIESFYKQDTHLRIGAKNGDPVPERGMCKILFFFILILIFFVLCFPLLWPLPPHSFSIPLDSKHRQVLGFTPK